MLHLRKYGLFIVFGVIIIVGAIFLNRENEQELKVSQSQEEPDALAGDNPEVNDDKEVDKETVEITVDVKGAVLDPGIYHLEDSARVYDAIEQAGGLLEQADEKQINLAERLADEMFVYVPEEGEFDSPTPTTGQATSISTQSDGADMIRVNNASVTELEELNGVGPSKAQAIADYIEENGPLSEVNDMLDISGIGEKTLDNFKDQIIVP